MLAIGPKLKPELQLLPGQFRLTLSSPERFHDDLTWIDIPIFRPERQTRSLSDRATPVVSTNFSRCFKTNKNIHNIYF